MGYIGVKSPTDPNSQRDIQMDLSFFPRLDYFQPENWREEESPILTGSDPLGKMS